MCVCVCQLLLLLLLLFIKLRFDLIVLHHYDTHFFFQEGSLASTLLVLYNIFMFAQFHCHRVSIRVLKRDHQFNDVYRFVFLLLFILQRICCHFNHFYGHNYYRMKIKCRIITGKMWKCTHHWSQNLVVAKKKFVNWILLNYFQKPHWSSTMKTRSSCKTDYNTLEWLIIHPFHSFKPQFFFCCCGCCY